MNKSAPKYNPKIWNKNKYIRNSHNCYSYFLNKINHNEIPKCKKTYKKYKTCNRPQPGYYNGITRKTQKNYSCKNMIKRIKQDNPNIKYKGQNNNFKCEKQEYKGALVVSKNINKNCDYHFYREDRNGKWSHKDGATPATNKDAKGKLIKDPKIASRKYQKCDYTKYCGYFCIPKSSRKKNMRHRNKSKKIKVKK